MRRLRTQIKGSGIGTSATRAEILKKLFNIKYLALNKKTQVITPTLLGEMIFDVVNCSIRQLLNPELTASWEKGLTYVAEGSITEQEYMDKLEHFVRVRTRQVEASNYQYNLRQFFDAAAVNYRKPERASRQGGKKYIMMKDFTISNMLDLNETIAAELFVGKNLIRGRFFRRSEISLSSWEKHWILLNMRRRAKMYGSQDPLQLRRLQVSPDRLSLAETPRCATVRLSAARLSLVRAPVVGNSTELKNAVLFNKVQVPHYNYVGDAVLGYKSHMGAGSICSNVKYRQEAGCRKRRG